MARRGSSSRASATGTSTRHPSPPPPTPSRRASSSCGARAWRRARLHRVRRVEPAEGADPPDAGASDETDAGAGPAAVLRVLTVDRRALTTLLLTIVLCCWSDVVWGQQPAGGQQAP